MIAVRSGVRRAYHIGMNDRLARIGARARHMAYLDALSTEGASMARAPNTDDFEHAKARLRESGARWAARSRGIL